MVAGLCHFVFSPRNNERTKRHHTNNRNNGMRKDEIIPREKTKYRNPPHEKSKFQHEKTKKRHAKRRPLKLSICRRFAWRFLSFRVALFCLFIWRSFVFSRGIISFFRVAFFRLFAWRLFAWRLFVFMHGVFSRAFSRGVISSIRVFFAWRYFGAKRRNGTNRSP